MNSEECESVINTARYVLDEVTKELSEEQKRLMLHTLFMSSGILLHIKGDYKKEVLASHMLCIDKPMPMRVHPDGIVTMDTEESLREEVVEVPPINLISPHLH